MLKRSLLRLLKTVALPLLLTSVACRQIVLVHTAGLSPWHGGGFGMFASLDRDERRILMTTVQDCDGRQWSLDLAATPQVLSPAAYTYITTFPTTPQLRTVAERGLAHAPQPLATEVTTAPSQCISRVQLQVWRLVYDGEAIAYEPITSLVEVQP